MTICYSLLCSSLKLLRGFFYHVHGRAPAQLRGNIGLHVFWLDRQPPEIPCAAANHDYNSNNNNKFDTKLQLLSRKYMLKVNVSVQNAQQTHYGIIFKFTGNSSM